MSDENKTPETEQPVQGSEEALNDELNNLKDIFQKEWQKTMEESEKESPVIQELDDAGDPEEEPDGKAEDEPQQSAEPEDGKKKKKKKEGKKRSRVPLVILIIILILIIIPLLLYFICSVKVPNFNELIASYSAALSAEDDAERLAAYEDVASYCDEASAPDWFMQSIYEEIVVLTCKTEGYASALSYMETNMTEEMTANPKSDEFKDFLKIGDAIDSVAENAFASVAGEKDNGKSADDMDFDALAASLGAPDLIKSDVASALKSIAEGMALEEAAETEDDFNEAISQYFNAISVFSSLGADVSSMYEDVAVKVYNAGYLYETNYIIENYFDEEQLASPKSDAFAAVLDDLDALSSADIDVYSVALACYENNTYSDADLKNAINVTLPDQVKAALVNIAKDIIDGVKSEEEKNLTKAAEKLSASLNTLSSIGLDVTGLAKRLISLYLVNGDTQSANSLKETYITDEVLADSSDEFKADLDELTKLYDAQYAVNEVFYPFYSNAYYNGGELDKDEINAALDELVTDDADEYLLAFVSYYKYLTEGFTDEDPDIMLGYLTDFAEKMSGYPVLYGTSLAEVYRLKGEYDKAEEVAKEVLEVNIADDYSNSIIALMSRIDGDVDAALKAAEKGIELSGSTYYCGAEAVVDLILKGDIEKAFDYAKDLYDANLTVDNCEYILILAALYDGSDEDLKAELDGYKTDISDIFENYGITVSDNAQALIDGTLTPEDVFLKAPYSLG